MTSTIMRALRWLTAVFMWLKSVSLQAGMVSVCERKAVYVAAHLSEKTDIATSAGEAESVLTCTEFELCWSWLVLPLYMQQEFVSLLLPYRSNTTCWVVLLQFIQLQQFCGLHAVKVVSYENKTYLTVKS